MAPLAPGAHLSIKGPSLIVVFVSETESPCLTAPCSHVCLLSDTGTYTCACPDEMRLRDDGITCIGEATNHSAAAVYARARVCVCSFVSLISVCACVYV